MNYSYTLTCDTVLIININYIFQDRYAMKKSIYNFFISDKEENIHLIYNSFKNTLVCDENKKIQEFISHYGFNHKIYIDPQCITEEEYRKMISAGIIIPMEMNERELAININKKRIDSEYEKSNSLHLVITPTLCCNFKCYYCFESTNIRKKDDSMKVETQNDIINFVEKSITDNNITEVSITWYGGEPLIEKDILFVMQEKINIICKVHNVEIYSEIITNGFLLSSETCDSLFKLGIKRAQVTIDGPEQIHNKRRYYPINPKKNYRQIIKNIANGNEGIRFDIRINIDRANENFIWELIEDLIKRKIWPYKKNVSIYTAHVESVTENNYCLSKKEFVILQDQIRHYLMEKYNEINRTNNAKLHFYYPECGGELGCGYGIYKNSWVINYNGDVFRCWESVGQKEHCVGTIKELLDDFGLSIIERIKIDNNAFKQWGCFDCAFFPICGAGCPWEHLNKLTKRRCTKWKDILEYRLLNQYKQYLADPEVFKLH